MPKRADKPVLSCPQCGHPFKPRVSWQRFCRQECMRTANRLRGPAYTRAYRLRHPDRVKASAQKLTEYHKQYSAKWAKANPERVKAKSRAFRQRNLERLRARDRAFCAANREKRRLATKRWREANRDKRREYERQRRKQDIQFLIESRLRARVRGALRTQRAHKAARFLELVGCTREDLIAHIESLFVPSMNWDNREKWHIDHVRPVASFDLSKPDEQIRCFHFSNLRPVWASVNHHKSDKWSGQLDLGLQLYGE